MILVQDQYRQYSRKNFDSEVHLKQDTSKQFFSDSQGVWEVESGAEEEILSSGNNTEQEDIIYENPSEIPEELLTTRRQVTQIRKKIPKNVRFEKSDFGYGIETSETASFNEEYVTMEYGYPEEETYDSQGYFNQDLEMTGHRMRDNFRKPHTAKCRAGDCYDKKFGYEGRPKSTPEKASGNVLMERRLTNVESNDPRRLRRKEHNCGRSHYDNFDVDFTCGDATCTKNASRTYKFEHGDDITVKNSTCCDYHFIDEGRSRQEKKCHPKMKFTTGHSCQMFRDQNDSEILGKNLKKSYKDLRISQDVDSQGTQYYSRQDRYCLDDYHDHGCGSKMKKKVLEAVQEQQEQLSDSTYKVPCSKYSNQTISGDLADYPGKRSLEKLINSSHSDWMYCNGKIDGSCFREKINRDVHTPRIHKMRSRRTRINRLKNGWKKVFVQTVKDKTRNESVGVILIGPEGPEFYSKTMKKNPALVPFRKSKSFLEGAKSSEVMNVDCMNVFLSSSEPGPRVNYTGKDLISPEDDTKVEDKIARFSKNVNEIVKNSEEKFYNDLSSNDFQDIKKPMEKIFEGAGEGQNDEKEDSKIQDTIKSKFPTYLTYEATSPRASKYLQKSEKKVNEESKAMAEALNEKAKKYKETQTTEKIRKENLLEELREKFPPKEINQETANANLAFWGMKLDDLSENYSESAKDQKDAGDGICKGNVKEMIGKVNCSDDNNPESKINRKEKIMKDEMSQSGSVKSNEQISINKQRRKKYYESTTAEMKKNQKMENSCAGDAPKISKKEAEVSITNKHLNKITKWTDSPNMSFDIKSTENKATEPDASVISAVFRDLVEKNCAISREASENLQSMLNQSSYNTEVFSNDALSVISSENTHTIPDSKIKESPESPSSSEIKNKTDAQGGLEMKKKKKERVKGDYYEETNEEDGEDKEEKKLKEDYETDGYRNEQHNRRKVSKIKNYFDGKVLESKGLKKGQGKHKEGKGKKKIVLEDKIKILRKALPSIAAESEAAHLKQLKKYIDRFIDREEASTSTEFRKKKETQFKSKESVSTDSSEIKVDAWKILDFVSNPFKKISSDVTINIAKKLTDALVQEKGSKNVKNSTTRGRKSSKTETEEEKMASGGTPPCERCVTESEPTYLKQLKKMRNEHLNNIILEVGRLKELLRFLDRCNRLNF